MNHIQAVQCILYLQTWLCIYMDVSVSTFVNYRYRHAPVSTGHCEPALSHILLRATLSIWTACLHQGYRGVQDTEETTLLLVVGADTYQIACNLCSLGLPSTKSYEELKTLLLGYFKPKVNVVAQCFCFHK